MVEVTSVEEYFDEEASYVTVFNAAGQLVYSGRYAQLDWNGLRQGVYVMRFTSNHGKTIVRKHINPIR